MIEKRAFLLCLVFFILINLAFGAADVPTNVSLTSDLNSVTVTWSGNSKDDGYYVYYGTSSNDISKKSQLIDKNEKTYTITQLDSGTTYYVQVVSENNNQESARSNYVQIDTKADATKPAVPTGLAVSGDVGETSVTLTWTANTEDDLDFYTVSYGTDAAVLNLTKKINASVAHQATIDGLSASTRYYFAVSVTDTTGNKSDNSTSLIVDTLGGQIPPEVPASIDAEISGSGAIRLAVDPGNADMADFAGVKLYYGSASGVYDNEIDLGTETSYTLTGLEQDSTWYFAATAYDKTGNESLKTSEVSIRLERTTGFLDPASGFDGGCFISTAASKEKEKAEKKNRVGVSAGYLWTAEKNFKSFYGKDRYPVFIFLDRDLSSDISVEISAGFMRRSGKLRTVTGTATDISSTMTLVPVAASLDYNFEIIPHVIGFVGSGLDFWYINEKPDLTVYNLETKEWVGGYHGHGGVWLYNTDPAYSNWGVRIEGNYSEIKRFGGNDLDIGGWICDIGFFYRF